MQSQAVQLLSFDAKGNAVLSDTALSMLQSQFKAPLCIVSIVGDLKTGKSTLGNAILKQLGVNAGSLFGSKDRTSQPGVWMWSKPLKSLSGQQVLVLDMESPSESNNDPRERVATAFASLVSGDVILNVKGPLPIPKLDEQQREAEEVAEEALTEAESTEEDGDEQDRGARERRKRKETNHSACTLEVVQFSKVSGLAPKLTVLLRDISQDYLEQVDNEGIDVREVVDQWLESAYEDKGKKKKSKAPPKSYVTAKPLDEEDMALCPQFNPSSEFGLSLARAADEILSKLTVKRIGTIGADGVYLASAFLPALVKSLNAKSVVIPALIEAYETGIMKKLLDEALLVYRKQSYAANSAASLAEFDKVHLESFNAARAKLQEGLQKFSVPGDAVINAYLTLDKLRQPELDANRPRVVQIEAVRRKTEQDKYIVEKARADAEAARQKQTAAVKQQQEDAKRRQEGYHLEGNWSLNHPKKKDKKLNYNILVENGEVVCKTAAGMKIAEGTVVWKVKLTSPTNGKGAGLSSKGTNWSPVLLKVTNDQTFTLERHGKTGVKNLIFNKTS